MTLVEKEPKAIKLGITNLASAYICTTKIRPAILPTVDFLLIGGGGAGGGFASGGGGAGGVVYCQDYLLEPGEYSVCIGSGGNGYVNSSYYQGCNGGNSTFNNIIAYGGGGGAGCRCKGSNGGSGGGGGNYGYCLAGGTGCAGQGYQGGIGTQYGSYNGGGGGGAGGAGDMASTSCTYCGGMGGIGIQSDISGTNVWYAGGGSGFAPVSQRKPIPASCGGTGSGNSTVSNATNYGAGGGAYYAYCGSWGKGGNGIFILRYPTAAGRNITGGTKYTCGDYTIHCFTSNGTLTVN